MKKYFYAINKDQLGPYSLDEILTKNLHKNTLVWCEGLPDWVRLSEIPELNIKKDESLPPPIRVKESSSRKKNFIKILSIIAFIGAALIVSGIFLYPKWENEMKYEEALSVYMRTNSIQFEVFNELAIKGHTKSNFILGLYYNQSGDSIKAKKSFAKSIVKGNEVPALYLLSIDNLQYSDKLEEYFTDWVDGISDSDWLSQLYAGKIYNYGIGGLKPNPIKAIEFYDKASKNGSIEAILRLGEIYYSVEEVKDYEKAYLYLHEADKLGSFFAAGGIGYLYMQGFGSRAHDQSESIYWFTKGAKMNDIFSEYMMGILYDNELESINVDSAKYWHQRVLENNKPQNISKESVKEYKNYMCIR